MPKEVLIHWQRELEDWLQAHQLPQGLAEPIAIEWHADHEEMLQVLSQPQRNELRRHSNRIFHRSLDDCHGKCLLKNSVLAKIVADAMLFHHETEYAEKKYAEKKYDLERFVVMPNQVHAIVQFRPGSSLDIINQSWMRYSAPDQ